MISLRNERTRPLAEVDTASRNYAVGLQRSSFPQQFYLEAWYSPDEPSLNLMLYFEPVMRPLPSRMASVDCLLQGEGGRMYLLGSWQWSTLKRLQERVRDTMWITWDGCKQHMHSNNHFEIPGAQSECPSLLSLQISYRKRQWSSSHPAASGRLFQKMPYYNTTILGQMSHLSLLFFIMNFLFLEREFCSPSPLVIF